MTGEMKIALGLAGLLIVGGGVAIAASSSAAAAQQSASSSPVSVIPGVQTLDVAPGTTFVLQLPQGAKFQSGTFLAGGKSIAVQMNAQGQASFVNPAAPASVTLVWTDASGAQQAAIVIILPPGAALSNATVVDPASIAVAEAALMKAAQGGAIPALSTAIASNATLQQQLAIFQQWVNTIGRTQAGPAGIVLPTLPTTGTLDYATFLLLNAIQAGVL